MTPCTLLAAPTDPDGDSERIEPNDYRLARAAVIAHDGPPAVGHSAGLKLDRQQGRLRSITGASLLIALSLLVAFAIDRFLVPPSYVGSALYAIPILFSAHRFSPRAVAGVGLLSISLNLLSAYLGQTPMSGWLFGLLALLLLSYLALMVAKKRQQATQRTREAEEARYQLQQFLGLVSHELAQPLTTIQGYAQLLGRQAERRSQTGQRAPVAIDAAIRQLHRLTDDLHDAAQVGTDHFTIRPSWIDLVVLLRAVVTEQQASTSQHQIILNAPEPVSGTWDQDRLRQLFTNLLANGIKYSPHGGNVCTRVQQSGREVLISVTDRGTGMTPEQCAVLFQPFTRFNQSDAVPGNGLGLYISRAIVEAHGGRIWVESEAGQGTTFSVSLPLANN